MKEDKKKVYLKYWGCQMNVRDSEIICGLLKTEGYEFSDKPDNADIILFNTCSVRQHAEDKVWSEIGRYKDKKVIGVIGCMAANYKDSIFEKSSNVNLVVGPQDIHQIPDIIKKLMQDQGMLKRKIWETDSTSRPEEIYHTGFYQDKEHSFVVISEGCSNYCSYCVVPYVRKELRNRKFKDILREIEEVIDKGITRITLLGQNVNAYKDDDVDFIGLIRQVNLVKGLQEFSFVTSHPKDTSPNLFKEMENCQKLKKYLHLPVQSGSDRILKLMNRGYDRRFYLDLITNYRKIVKDGQLSTDIIVGFPSETEQDFRDTYNLVEDAKFKSSYIFKYSTRPHTQAAKMTDDVSKGEKEKRHRLILELQKEISKKNKC